MNRRFVVVGFSLVVLTVGSVGWLAKDEISGVLSAFRTSIKAHEFLVSATRFRSLLVDEDNRAPKASEALEAGFNELRRWTSDSASQQRRLKQLEVLLQQRRGSVDNAAGRAGLSARSNETGDAIRLLLSEMEFEEQTSIQELDQRATAGTTSAFLLVALGTILTLVTIIGAGVLTLKQLRAARNSEFVLSEYQRNTEAILSAAGQGVCHFAPTGKITYANIAAAQLLGRELSELIGEDGHVLIHHSRADGSPYPVEECAIRRAIATGVPQRIKGEVYWRKDGTSFPVEQVCTPIKKAGRITGGLVTFADVSVRESTVNQLQKANEQLVSSLDELHKRSLEIERLSEIAQLLQISQNMDEACKVATAALCDVFPGKSGAICLISASHNLVDIVAQWGPSYTGESVFAPDQCWALRRGKPHVSVPDKATNRCGHTRKDHTSNHLCIPMMAQGDAIGVFHLSSDLTPFSEPQRRLAVAIAEQVTLAFANLRLQETLRQQSIRDPLTGLFNRRYLEESVERELRRAERHHKPLAVLMIDIDHFKRFNDTFGHDAGDAMLREIGQLLVMHVRAEDIASRYGGEELAVVMPDTSLEKSNERAMNILELVKRLNVTFRGQAVGTVTVSIGIATYPENGEEWQTLFHAADLALYRAKKEGRDRVIIADRQIDWRGGAPFTSHQATQNHSSEVDFPTKARS